MTERYRPIVDVTISPNEVLREYSIAEHDGALTATPHLELLGVDISNLVEKDTPPMDDETKRLYRAVKALSSQIKSVSIEPQKLTIEGPTTLDGDYYYSNWPEGLYIDSQAIRCIALHLRWQDAPFMRLRHQTKREVMMGVDDNIIEELRLGMRPPKGWPYAPLGF